MIKMMRYDYELIFKKGSTNVMADALSKMVVVQLQAIYVFNTDLLQRIK